MPVILKTGWAVTYRRRADQEGFHIASMFHGIRSKYPIDKGNAVTDHWQKTPDSDTLNQPRFVSWSEAE